MEFIILLVILVISSLILRYVFDVNLNKIKEIADNERLNQLTKKYPENIEICKEYLSKLNNENVNVEENKDSNSTVYMVVNNKILIANLKDNYTRIQTIAHECLHSIQSKKLLWFNFIFSNIYLLYFLIISVLAIFKVLPYEMMFFSIFLIFGFIYYDVRAYLENDAMTKARFLAKEYMQEKSISTKEEIDEIVNKYDELNDIGIKCVNFQLLNGVLNKAIALLVIFMIF